MLGRRLAGTTGIRSITTLPGGPGSREQPRSAAPLADRPGPGRLGRPQTTRARNAGGERVVAMPQPPGRADLQPARILLGVDQEHPTGAAR